MAASQKMILDPRFMGKLAHIRKRCYTKISSLNVSYATGKEPLMPGQGEYKAAKKFDVWSPPHSFTCAQFHINGHVPEGEDPNKLGIIFNISGEGLISDKEGVPTIGMTSKFTGLCNVIQAHPAKTLVPISKVSDGKEIDFFMDASYNGLRCLGVVFSVDLVRINQEIKDFYYDYLFCAYVYRAYKYPEAKKILSESYKLFNSGKVSDARNVLTAFNRSYKGVDAEFYCVGHAHLDLVWLWPKRESMRKSARTFTNQIYNMECYPGFVFGQSQPQQYEWIKEQQPELFEKLKQKYKEGALELQGGLWVESDTNLAGGEALVRQIKYGQKFWKENFGFTSDMCWLPDVFGYNGNLPQILAKSGINNFMTIKLSWNNVNKFPYHTFHWKGIDGSEVLVHMPPSGNYVGDGTPACFEEAYRFNREKNVKKILFEFGVGDGGGGPNELQLEMIKREMQKEKPNVKFSSAEQFFKDLRAENYDLPSYQGELYLEKHQGTYTTQGKMKKYNRRLEYLLAICESVWTRVYLKTGEYPSEKIERIWKDMLFYQFHDSLPGSSINRVYKEANAHQEELISQVNKLIDKGIEMLDGCASVFNPAPVPFDGAFVDGGKCYRLSAPAFGTSKAVLIENDNSALKINKYSVENDCIKLDFENDGSFVLFDKTQNKNLGRFNEMRIYCDPRIFFNAWEIAPWYTKLPRYSFRVESVENKIVGDALIRNQVLKFGRSSVKQKITIYAGDPEIRIENVAVLNRRHHQLRCDNTPTTYSDKVTCDIQFGNIKRPTTDNDSIEKARYEICSHKYLDLNNGSDGIAFMSDCKYGSRVKKGKVSLTLVRNPIYPDPKADRGEQTFTVSIYPYRGKFEDSDVVARSYRLNIPLRASARSVEKLFDLTGNVVCELSKKGDVDGTIAFRIYDPHGQAVKASFVPKFKYSVASETDLQENNCKDVDLNNLKFDPFEVKTLVFKVK